MFTSYIKLYVICYRHIKLYVVLIIQYLVLFTDNCVAYTAAVVRNIISCFAVGVAIGVLFWAAGEGAKWCGGTGRPPKGSGTFALAFSF